MGTECFGRMMKVLELDSGDELQALLKRVNFVAYKHFNKNCMINMINTSVKNLHSLPHLSTPIPLTCLYFFHLLIHYINYL